MITATFKTHGSKLFWKKRYSFEFYFHCYTRVVLFEKISFGFNVNFQDVINEVMGNKLTHGSQCR
jgi:hypothetical protein